ncbi:hypothetical protein EYF80_028068 [Liparis tanakae]|uniref:Uncharacterized protein n=1 Tax=Liparis tanakae TaxID=230148 RepID=A0A4Z2H7G1_9TELE|nr:hypothetical protein EYF80_028068 [Liparis tanakae]
MFLSGKPAVHGERGCGLLIPRYTTGTRDLGYHQISEGKGAKARGAAPSSSTVAGLTLTRSTGVRDRGGAVSFSRVAELLVGIFASWNLRGFASEGREATQ